MHARVLHGDARAVRALVCDERQPDRLVGLVLARVSRLLPGRGDAGLADRGGYWTIGEDTRRAGERGSRDLARPTSVRRQHDSLRGGDAAVGVVVLYGRRVGAGAGWIAAGRVGRADVAQV